MKRDRPMSERIQKTEREWRAQLTPEQYKVTREHGTERAGTSPLNEEKRGGVFACVCCGAPLFNSGAKIPIGERLAELLQAHERGRRRGHADRSFLMHRTEVRCANAMRIWGMSFQMGRSPPAFATA